MRPDFWDEIIAQLDGFNIPPKFVLMGRFVTPDGMEHTLSGPELTSVLKGTDPMPPLTEVRLLLNVAAIKKAMIDDVTATFALVNEMIRERRVRGLPPPPPERDSLF